MADALLKANPGIINKLKAEDAPICTDSKEFENLIKDDPSLQGIQVEPMADSSNINAQLQNIDVDQMGDSANINPGNNLSLNCTLNLFIIIFLLDYFLSGPFSESMKISDNQQKVSSRNIQRQNSELETPDVSMEQSKSKTTLNNLG